jgi:hypothetical protein
MSDDSTDVVWTLGLEMMSRLRELELRFEDDDGPSYADRGGHYPWDRDMYESYCSGKVIPAHVFFHDFLAARRHNFKTLDVLTLRDIVFEQATMCDFLAGLTKLRTLHLIDCTSLGTYACFLASLEAAMPTSFHLAGAEIYRLRFLDDEIPTEPRPILDQGMRDKMRVKRSLDYDLAVQCDLLSEFYPFTARDWPCERRELEDAIVMGCTRGRNANEVPRVSG